VDTPILIVGSGFAAAAAVVHLVDHGIPCKSLTVVGPGALGAGQAYGCVSPFFRLNVRPDIQRLWPEEPDHFPDWARRHINDPQAQTPLGPFYRRSDFARYIADELQRLPNYDALNHLSHVVTDIRKEQDRWILTTANGPELTAAQVVIASGNTSPQWPGGIDAPKEPSLIQIPWRGDWIHDVDRQSPVCLVGSGLTAMDAIYALHETDHQGPVYVLSPYGLLPPVQLDWKASPAIEWPSVHNARSFIHAMRSVLKHDEWLDQEWQERFEALRVGISGAWQQLPVHARLKLIRRLGWLWSLQRFRASPQTVQAADRMRERGQLNIVRASMVGLSPSRSKQWLVSLSDDESIACRTVINCTGAGRDPLIVKLAARQIIGTLSEGGAPSVNPRQQLLSPDDVAHQDLFLMGASSGLALGDVVGSTSIARQAVRLAKTVTSTQAA
jgi:uncharacterized NAD(P)/FAD-binding protein YdhS